MENGLARNKWMPGVYFETCQNKMDGWMGGKTDGNMIRQVWSPAMGDLGRWMHDVCYTILPLLADRNAS